MYRWLKNWLGNAPAAVPEEPRRAARFPEPCVVVYYWDGATPTGRQLRDLSLTGAYLYTSERWYPGTIVRLLLQERHASESGCDCSGPRGSVSIPARVVRQGPDGVGLEFLFSGPEDRKLLERLIAAVPNRCLAVPVDDASRPISRTPALGPVKR